MKILENVRKGELNLNIEGGPEGSAARVINRIPNIFTHADSNTRIDPLTQTLEADTPPESGRRNFLDDWDVPL